MSRQELLRTIIELAKLYVRSPIAILDTLMTISAEPYLLALPPNNLGFCPIKKKESRDVVPASTAKKIFMLP